jgi:hypothetical protein
VAAVDPAAPANATSPKVYVVYVTVVEVDAEGNETVLFTPKVQTTGQPAGVTVDHIDGRSFEFQCRLAATEKPVLEQIPSLAKGSKSAGEDVAPVPTAIAPANVEPTKDHSSTERRARDVFFVRTYDVSDLLEPTDVVTAADFEPLIQTLKSVAAPESWTGKATIRPFASTRSLVVKQNEAGHKAVAAALHELRPRKLGADEEQ